MTTITLPLKAMGLDSWFLDQLPPEALQQFGLGRVLAVHRESYVISNGQDEVLAELVGKILFSASSPVDFPAVGDWVLATFFDDNSLAIIQHILPRRSLLKRKTPGRKVDVQLIAANIDVAFIVQSLNENFNLPRLERYLAMVHDAKVQPIVLLSKSDLLDQASTRARVAQIHTVMPDLHVLPFSNESESAVQQVKAVMEPGRSYCLLGSSGVGKTSLLNNLLGAERYLTRTVSKKENKGRHVTTHRHLVKLQSGALLVDTPGMRELGNLAISTGIERTFQEISELARQCQFSNCSHSNEKGCAVLAALAAGQLSHDRYQNYLKMNRESAYNEMSYLDKRKKDKQFGKHVKSVMKQKMRHR